MSNFQDFTEEGIPIAVSEPGSERVSLDMIYDKALHEVRETLPGAYYQGMVFSGRCEDLKQLRGQLVLDFLQVRPGIRQQAIRAIASVDIVQQEMNLQYQNESDYAIVTEPGSFPENESIQAVVKVASDYIYGLEIKDCDVTVTQLMDNSWDVRCGPLSNFVQQCRFRIDDGEIIVDQAG
jgi:hypothetical protein